MHCSLKGPGWATARQCNQYPEYCTGEYIGNITAPYQQQYIDDYARSGTHAKGGNGGFFHSCCARKRAVLSCQKRRLSWLSLRARSRLVFPLGLGGHGDLEHHQDQRPQHAPSHRQLVARRRDTARRAVQAQCRALPRRGCMPRGRRVPIAHARRRGGLDYGLHVGSGAAGAAQVDQQNVRRLAVRRQPHGQARLL